MSLANLSMCSETHSGFIGKISWVSLCSRAPGGCLGASGQAEEVAIDRFLPVTGVEQVPAVPSIGCPLWARLRLLRVSVFPAINGVGETTANVVAEVFTSAAVALRIVVSVEWILSCSG